MNIPNHVKIGGTTYQVEISEMLSLGTANFSAEIDYQNLIIRITPQAEEKMQCDLLHEIIHGIFSQLGYAEHDEKHIEELARALFALVKDNPELMKEGDIE